MELWIGTSIAWYGSACLQPQGRTLQYLPWKESGLMEIVKEFSAHRFASLAQWFHFCNIYQLQICPHCQRSARQAFSTPVPVYRWSCSVCCSESGHRNDPPACPQWSRQDDVAAIGDHPHGVGSKVKTATVTKLPFLNYQFRVI